MPIPFLFIAAAAGTGAVGVKKSIDAKNDQGVAESTNEKAKKISEDATRKINVCRRNSGEAIRYLGECKITVLNKSIRCFIREFEKLHHVELTESTGLNELQKISLDKKAFVELKKQQDMAACIAGGMASGAMAGAITAFGAYGVAGAFATASTGTAIASLSGAAATNATLAFFGGGALSIGGLGMAGGAAVLGGLVAGPALAVMGAVVGAKASKNKEQAYSNLAKAEEYREEMAAAADGCIGIRKRAAMFSRYLIALNTVFEPLIYEMTDIISERGTDFRAFTEEEKKVVAEAMAMAGAVKSILDTPILTKEGKLTQESDAVARKIIEKCI